MTVIIKTGTFLLNILYFFIKLLPVRNKITMISRQSNQPGVDFRMIQKEMKKRHPDMKIVLLCHTLDGGLKSGMRTRIIYCFHMLRQMYHIATSKVVILDTYCIPISLLHHRKSLKVIQIWHSMGTMKKFGYTTLDTDEGTSSKIAYAMKMHQNYDYIFASSEAYRDHLAAGFHCDPEKIITMPLPRLDLLVNDPDYAMNKRREIYAKYPQLKEKPVILYCPTFRKEESAFKDAMEKLADAIDTDRFHLVVKLHPLSKVKPDSRVITADGFSSADMIYVADYMISDYSCIVYEAAVRGVPLFFYDFDMDFYKGGRGLAIDYFHELPGVISPDAHVIADAIQREEANGDYDRDALKKFADKYIRPTEHATADIGDFIDRLL